MQGPELLIPSVIEFVNYNCRNLIVYCGQNAGSSFIIISHWEPEHSSDYEGFEESSGTVKKSSICEANFWFSSSSRISKGFRPECWCSCIDGMCADTDFCSRRLPDPYRVYGKHCLMLWWQENYALYILVFAAIWCILPHSTHSMFLMLVICTLLLYCCGKFRICHLTENELTWFTLIFKLKKEIVPTISHYCKCDNTRMNTMFIKTSVLKATGMLNSPMNNFY